MALKLRAALLLLLFASFIGKVSAQDFTPPISNGAFQVVVSSGNTNAAQFAAGFNAPAGQYTYICGWNVQSNGATAAATVGIVITNLIGQVPNNPVTLTYEFNVPAVGTTFAVASDKYWPCLRSNGPGVGIGLAVPQTAGNTSTIIQMYGFTGQ